MKKYSEAEIGSLKKAEIINLLDKEKIDYDSSLSLYALRKMLLNIEKEEDVNVVEETNNDVANETTAEEEVIETAENNEEVLENNEAAAEEEVKDEPKVENVNNVIGKLNFKTELQRRRGLAGQGTKSAMQIELAKRMGRQVTKTSFAEELRLRQIKSRG